MGVHLGNYALTAAPVTINLGGVLNPTTAPTVLTGQQITASLNAPSGFTVKNYDWSITASGGGADIFKTYNEKASSGQLVQLANADFFEASLSFYDKSQETITVQYSGTLLAPDGKTSLAVTAKSLPISVIKPSATWNAQQLGVSDEAADKGFQANEVWGASITVPSPFTGGTGCFAQLVTPDRELTRDPQNSKSAVYYYKQQYTDGSGKTTWIIPGQGLDASLPYPLGIVNGKVVSPSGGYTWDVSQSGTSADTPFQYYTTADLDGGGTAWYKTGLHP